MANQGNAIPRLSFARTDDPFYREVRRRVRVYLSSSKGRSRFGGPRMWSKSLTIVAMLVGLGWLIYSGRVFDGQGGSGSKIAFVGVFMVWQFVQFLTTIGIAHDATHGSYSRSPRVNRALYRVFDLLGIDSRTWIETHIDSHHAMPNVPLHDSAITSFSLVRLHPRTKPTRLSRYQHLYMFVVYSLVTIFQVYILEPLAFAQGVVGYERRPGWAKALAKMIAKKAFVLGYSLILPLVILRGGPSWPLIVLGWVLGHMMCGIAIGIIFQSTHLHEGTEFIEPQDDESGSKGELPYSFAQHILRTTSEFAVENPIVTWIAGGLNLHTTHHLFPHVSQVHLPALSRIVRETAREYGAPYTHYSLFGAIRSHLRMLKKLGRLDQPHQPHQPHQRHQRHQPHHPEDAQKPQQPPKLGLLEVLREPTRFTQSRTDLLFEAALRHGPVVKLPKPFDRMFLLADPAAVKRVLVDNQKNWLKSEEYRPLAEWVGRGLITSEGEVWARDRRMTQPAFHREVLGRLSTEVRALTNAMMSKWKRGGRRVVAHHHVELDVHEAMLDLSLRIIGGRLFGCEMSDDHVTEIRVLMAECQEHVTNEMLVPFNFGRGRSRFDENMKRLRGLLVYLDEQATQESLASMLAKQGFDLHARLDHLLGILVAGHETTAVALTWTLFLLAKHPAAQERARNDEMFMNACIDESMRLYPPIPCFARRALEDDSLAGYHFRRGSKVIVAPHVMHRLPSYWGENSERFDPERFLGERRASIPKGAFMPFGMGPRTCIGASMAMMECRTILAMLLQNFVIAPAWDEREEPRARAMISLLPDRPVPLIITQRLTPGCDATKEQNHESRSFRRHHPPALASTFTPRVRRELIAARGGTNGNTASSGCARNEERRSQVTR
jgi:linoleoyl-CoA desaturase